MIFNDCTRYFYVFFAYTFLMELIFNDGGGWSNFIFAPKLVSALGQSIFHHSSSNSQQAAAAAGQLQPPLAFIRQDLNDLLAVMNADRVSNLLSSLANQEMGVSKMQTMLDELAFKNIDYDQSTSIKKIALSIEKKLISYQKMLDRVKNEVIRGYSKMPYDNRPFKEYRECCALENNILKFDIQFGSSVNTSQTCDITLSSSRRQQNSAFSFYPARELLKTFELNARYQTGLWQYFISWEGLHVEYPARRFDEKNYTNCARLEQERHKSIFIKTSLPYQKRVVILLDRGSAMSNNQLESAKCMAKALLSSLDADDEVTVLLVGDEVTYPTTLRCSNGKLFLATPDVKEHLYNFVSGVTKSNSHTNHTVGFNEAFNVLRSVHAKYTDRPMILYLSRGMFSQLTDGTSVMAAIAEANAEMGNSVQINTFALIDVGKAVMWETTFLRDVAAQNVKPYAQSFSPDLIALLLNRTKPPEGKMIIINSSNDYCVELSELYEAFKPADDGYRSSTSKSSSDSSNFQYTFNRPNFGCSTVSIAKIVMHKEKLLGIVGLDVCLRNLASPIVYYSSSDTTSYAFLIDKLGRAYVHPKLSNTIFDDVRLLDVSVLEDFSSTTDTTTTEQQSVLVSLKNGFAQHREGYKVVRLSNSDEKDYDNSTTKISIKTYYWKNIENTSFIIVVSSIGNANKEKNNRLDKRANLANTLVYHRLDLLINKDLRVCTQGKLLASSERCGLFLSPKCFDKAYERTLFSEDLRSAQGYWAYITDHTKLITNPGLKNEKLRNEIAEWSKLLKNWRQDYSRSRLKSVVLRRYIATPSGIMLMYPASYVHQNFDPTQRFWYRRALESPGRIILTQPVLDPSGFGFTVTISVAILEGGNSTKFSSASYTTTTNLHKPPKEEGNRNGRVVAVLAMDLPLTYLYKFVNEAPELGICREDRVNCFLFDDRGYVVAHRNAFFDSDASISQVYEQMHLTHKEPGIASEILQNKKFMQKIICNYYGGRTIQRYYVVNSSFSKVLRSTEGVCIRYQITPVPNTNVFLAIVNRSCVRQSAFCPCSVIDRKCLNCHRSEPQECECPCECPTRGLYCGDDSENDFSKYPACEAYQETVKAPLPDPILSLVQPLQPCMDVNCAKFSSESDCLGQMGCEWCAYSDAKQSLKMPYCSTVTQCYGGILGLSAYGNLEKNYVAEKFVASTPVGPMAGGIMSIFVVLVLVVLWYRHKVSRLVEMRGCVGGVSSRYGSRTGTGGSGSRLYDSDDMNDDFNFDNGGGGALSKPDCQENNGTLLLLTSFERENLPASSVPPRPRPVWRRGPRTESSDPGYSTMTGNCDESEQATTVGQLSPRRSAKQPVWPALLSSSDNDSSATSVISTCRKVIHQGQPQSGPVVSSDDVVTIADCVEEITRLGVDPESSAGMGKQIPQQRKEQEIMQQTVLTHYESNPFITTAIVHAVDA